MGKGTASLFGDGDMCKSLNWEDNHVVFMIIFGSCTSSYPPMFVLVGATFKSNDASIVTFQAIGC